MQIDNKFLDEIVKMATTAFGNATQAKKDMEESFRTKLASMISEYGSTVNQEEFQALKEMVQTLNERVARLERNFPVTRL